MIAFGALMLRDLTVLRKNFGEFVVRTVMQPLLFVFVFTYVFPQIGQGVGGRRAGGVLEHPRAGRYRHRMIFQGIQAVALPLVQEFGFTREIEDLVLAPFPVWAALERQGPWWRRPRAPRRARLSRSRCSSRSLRPIWTANGCVSSPSSPSRP